jgi:hypothetical protein
MTAARPRSVIAGLMPPHLVLMLALGMVGCSAALHEGPESPAQSAYLAQIDAYLSDAARRFADGRMSGRDYLTLATDRAGKARRFHDDAKWRAAATRGDRDGDAVPDPEDRCETPPLTPTGERGCPLPRCDPRDPACGQPSPDDDRRTRDLLDRGVLMFNPACENSLIPQTPEPLQWGRGTQTPTATMGFNLAVTEVTNQRPGCELFYEIEFRIEWQAPPGQQRLRYISVVFRASEDLKPADPHRAVFGIPMLPPVSPARDLLRQALSRFLDVRWRVRAVNGAQAASPWSAMRAQGPAAAGVDG